MKNRQFGEYLNKCRGSTSLQKLADIYGCTRSYMWDIVHGNVNPPQDYEKLKKIAKELNLSEKQTYQLFDMAALDGDIPADIKMILINNKEMIEEIRKKQKKGED